MGYEDGTTEVPEMAQGSIHIKESHEGIFTAKANSAGMGVQEYASKVLSAPEGRYDPSTRKQANFAKNASKWEGGVTGVPDFSRGRPDEPGFADGTTSVPQFSRGSSAQAGYADGTTGVNEWDDNTKPIPAMPQQTQNAWDSNALDTQIGQPVATAPVPPPAPTNWDSNAVEPQIGKMYLGTALNDAQVARSESGNNPTAQNPNSSAYGTYQMTKPAIDDVLATYPEMRGVDFQKNQEAFRDKYKAIIAGRIKSDDPTAINQAWVAGPAGYNRIAASDPSTPLEKILSPEAMALNPNLRGKTSGEYLASNDPYSVKGKGGVPVMPESADLIRSRQLANDPTISPY